jgi:hypothetical protein
MAEIRKLLPKYKTNVLGYRLPQPPDQLHVLLKKAGVGLIHDLK